MVVAYNGGSVTIQIIAGTPGTPKAISSFTNNLSKITNFGNKNVVGVENINFSLGFVERVALKGSGAVENRGHTPGIIRFPDASLTLWNSELIAWMDKYPNLQEFLLTSFQITIAYRVDGFPMQKIELLRCFPKQIDHNHSMDDSGQLLSEISFYVGEVKLNGKGFIGDALNALGNFSDVASNFL